MDKLSLAAQSRTIQGRKVKSLRSQGILPANIYGKKTKSQSIQISLNEFKSLYKQTGETNLISLQVDKEKETRPVLVTNLQKHPVTDLPLHVDFHQVDLSEKVSVSVPVELVGTSLAVKEKGAVLITLLDEIKIEALPQDLPDKFVLDISSLQEFGDSLLVKDLKLDKGKITVVAEEDEAIVIAQQPKEEEEPAPAPVQAEAEAEATPATGEGSEEQPQAESKDKPQEKKESK